MLRGWKRMKGKEQGDRCEKDERDEGDEADGKKRTWRVRRWEDDEENQKIRRE